MGENDTNDTGEGTADERIIRKIKACLARAQSSNEHEAEIAMRQAIAMMERYRLSEADIEAHDEIEINETLVVMGKRIEQWKYSLADAAAEVFHCKAVFHRRPIPGEGRARLVGFIGHPANAKVAEYAYESLVAQAEAALKQARKDAPAGKKINRAGFCTAWANAARRKVLDAFAERNKGVFEDAAEAQALIALEDKNRLAIERWMAEQYPRIKAMRRSSVISDDDSILAGRKAGMNAAIHQGIGAAPGKVVVSMIGKD